jgi:hypothetical protein
MFDIWVPNAVGTFFREQSPNDPRLLAGRPEAYHQLIFSRSGPRFMTPLGNYAVVAFFG